MKGLTLTRGIVFNVVGALGAGVQLACLWVLWRAAGLHYLPATALATEAAVLHNFAWHQRWTWKDRPASRAESWRRLARFNLSNGVVSLCGNLIVMAVLVGGLQVPVLAANLVAIVLCSLLNLVISDVWVFRSRLAVMVVLATLGLAAPAVAEAGPRPAALAAFERHLERVAARNDERAGGRLPFLWLDDNPARAARVRSGAVEIGPADGPTLSTVPGGLVHDWIGAVFVPGARVGAVIALVQDYDRHAVVYAPDVMASRLLQRDGERFTARLRLHRQAVITVVLDTVHVATYARLDDARWRSRSATTSVREVRNAGQPDEVVLDEQEGHGFLWRLDSFWSFEERDGGVYIECRAVSLSRGIPIGLGWLVEPFVTRVPREALTRTLDATRRAVTAIPGYHDGRFVPTIRIGERPRRPQETRHEDAPSRDRRVDWMVPARDR